MGNAGLPIRPERACPPAGAVSEPLIVGASASLSLTITAEHIERFAQITGDTNPVHLDAAYAESTRFGGRIAHGMLLGGLISAVLGTRLPGPGSIYLRQELAFKAPARIGDTVTASVRVASVRADKPIVTFETTCTNGQGTVLAEGEAVLLCEGGRA